MGDKSDENLKIAKLTLDGYCNYGNVLQNYALQEVLKKYGEVDCLWHSKDNFMPRVWYKMGWKDIVKIILNWRGLRHSIFSDYHGMEMIRQGKIKEWCDRYINIRCVGNKIIQTVSAYDFFVVGSDQVWNPYNNKVEDFFLFFVPPEKRIAYAASISCPELPSDKVLLYKKGFTEMAHISLREQHGADIVKKLIGRDVPVLVDPTLLLSPDDWRKVSRQPVWYHGKDYILTYFLGERPEVVAHLEQETGLKVVNLLDKDVYENYVTGPDEFIWAIEHAKLVYTDSFHGTVFSILFRTPFVVCNRIGNEVESKMGSRIDTLLGYFGLECRRGTRANNYTISNPFDEPDWLMVDEVLERERQRANDYLCEALGLKQH